MSFLPPQPPSWSQPHEPAPPPAPPQRQRANRWLVGALALLLVLLGGLGTAVVVQRDRLAQERTTAAALERELADARSEIERLEDEAVQGPAEDDGGGQDGGSSPLDDLEDMLDGDLGEMVEELEDLLGPDGPLGELGEQLGGDAGLGQPDTLGCLVGAEDLPDITGDTVEAQIASAVEVVEQIRGEEFPDPLEPAILTSEEIEQRVADEVGEVYDEDSADVDRRILSALGAVPADIDLIQTQTELLGAQVAGFYDPETQELVVRSDDPDEPLGALGLITLLHELEHALADATVGLPDLEDDAADEDAALAEIAVVEGDAVALQTIATSVALSPADLLGALSDPDALADASAGLDGVPHYLAQSLAFPYIEGPSYICEIYAEGGWDAVDAVLTDPPDTTAEILFPDADEAQEPPRPEPPEGFELLTRRTFGAAQLSWLFGAPGGDADLGPDDPQASVAGWRGGEVSLLEADGSSAVVLSLVDGGGLCDATNVWWEATAPQIEGEGVVACGDAQVLVGVADTAEIARAAVGQ